jgi:hypothetical protein
MRRHLPVILVLLSLAVPSRGFAQSGDINHPITRVASAAAGRVQGVVTDEAGSTIVGVSVLAVGAALAMARTDVLGRFSLVLPPGEYVLRATRDGYISTYREPVRIQSDSELRRSITLTRAGASAQAGEDLIEPADPDHAHSEVAWRLRHLSRTVLRDAAGAASYREALDFEPAADAAPLMARTGQTLFGDTGWNGQLNFITTSALASSGGAAPEWPRGVAHVVIGAPVGDQGDWAFRAAMTGGELPAWTVLGEFTSRDDRAHAFRTGVSFSSQAYATAPGPWLSMSTTADSRRVGGAYGYDRWTLARSVELQYGIKIDRYDYLADPTLVSAEIGGRVRVHRGVVVTASVAPRQVAPGADQFLPPGSSGPWLPPERTFSALTDAVGLRPETVTHRTVGIEVDLGRSGVLTVQRFSQASQDQIATLFGLDDASQVGHYYVATAGDVELDGWSIGVAGTFRSVLAGAVTYRHATAEWDTPARRRALRTAAPSVSRGGAETTHDLTASLEATLPVSATRILAAYRVNSAFSAPRGESANPNLDGRFSVEVRQHLPFQPFRGGELNLLLSARTLLRDLSSEGAFYDELLTVAPPTRLTCGLQMRF